MLSLKTCSPTDAICPLTRQTGNSADPLRLGLSRIISVGRIPQRTSSNFQKEHLHISISISSREPLINQLVSPTRSIAELAKVLAKPMKARHRLPRKLYVRACPTNNLLVYLTRHHPEFSSSKVCVTGGSRPIPSSGREWPSH